MGLSMTMLSEYIFIYLEETKIDNQLIFCDFLFGICWDQLKDIKIRKKRVKVEVAYYMYCFNF
jgi:hypothetical protein